MIAAAEGHAEVVEILLSGKDIDTGAIDRYHGSIFIRRHSLRGHPCGFRWQQTALDEAEKNGFTSVVKILGGLSETTVVTPTMTAQDVLNQSSQ